MEWCHGDEWMWIMVSKMWDGYVVEIATIHSIGYWADNLYWEYNGMQPMR